MNLMLELVIANDLRLLLEMTIIELLQKYR